MNSLQALQHNTWAATLQLSSNTITDSMKSMPLERIRISSRSDTGPLSNFTLSHYSLFSEQRGSDLCARD